MSRSELARILAEFERRERELPAHRYAWSTPASLMMHQQAVRGCIRLLHEAGLYPLNGRQIADIGCGDGTWMLEFVQWGAHPKSLSGIDLRSESVARARQRLPDADLHTGTASKLPWPDESFDLVSQFTVFTSLLNSELKQMIAQEMQRVLRPGGCVLWFDFRFDNPRNRNVRGIRAAEIHSLFKGCHVRLLPVLLAPPLTRMVAGWCWPLAELLHTLRPLRTHHAGLIWKKPA